MVEQINSEKFNKIAKSGIVVVDFFATWCGPCKMLSPVVEQLSTEMENVKFFKVDIDQEQSLAAKFGVTGVPAILVMRDGNTLGMLVGFKPKDVLKSQIENLL